MSGKKRRLPPAPGKKREKNSVTGTKSQPVAPPFEIKEVPPPKAPPAAPSGVLQEPAQEKSGILRPPVEPPPVTSDSPPVKEIKHVSQADLLGIPQDVAFQAALKARRTIPKPPPGSRQLRQVKESESVIAGSLDELAGETTDEPTAPSQVSLPKPTSYKAPPRPAINEDELGTESDHQEVYGTSGDNSSVMPSLPDISKFTQKKVSGKKKRKVTEYANIDYSDILQKPEEPPSHRMLVSEIQGVFTKGIKESLVKADKEVIMDDQEIEKERYRRMFEDYEAAGEKFQEMQLHVNAAQSYAMALVSATLSADVSAALWLLDEYDKLPAIIKEAEIYQVVRGLIGALKDKSTKKVAMAEEIIENLAFLSFDDKQLIKKCIKTIKARLT